MRGRRREQTVVRLTLAEAKALRDAAGFGDGEPTTPRDQAALDRALIKIDRAHRTFARSRRR